MTAPTINELRARVTERGPWFDVPANAVATRCRSCGCMVFFVTTAAGKPMPVDVLVPGGQMPHAAHAERPDVLGRGVSHFATCPDSKQWRRA